MMGKIPLLCVTIQSYYSIIDYIPYAVLRDPQPMGCGLLPLVRSAASLD